MNLDFTFGQSAWELALDGLKYGDAISATRLLTLLEGENEDAVQEAMLTLEQRHITLDLMDLPEMAASGNLAERLKREARLAKSGRLMQELEENDPLRLYLEELAAIPVAGDPEMLAMGLAEGGDALRERLVNLMLSQVVTQALQLAGHGVLLLDLIQEGSLGLWQAVLCFTEGNFEDHCRWWIGQSMAKAITVQALASGIGQKLRQSVEDYRDADRRLLTQLGRTPTPEEIAVELGISGEDAAALSRMLQDARAARHWKTDGVPEPVPEEENQSVENTAYFQSRQRIQELLAGLAPADARLISLRYGLEGGLPLDPEQVAHKLGISPENVVAREAAALQKLRQQGQS